MEIQIVPIQLEQKSVFVQMMNLYNYDFTEFENVDINEYGYYNYSNTDDLWNKSDEWHPFFIRVDRKLAGFVLVHNHCRYIDSPIAHNIDEFFIMKKYRRLGVGRYAAKFLIYSKANGKCSKCQTMCGHKNSGKQSYPSIQTKLIKAAVL